MAHIDSTNASLALSAARTIRYTFFTAGQPDIAITLRFDAKTHRLELPPDAPKPEWARLSCNKCPNCQLAETEQWCPAALGLATILPDFAGRVSHERSVVEVGTANRTVVTKTTLQQGLASLMGLICATSGCPQTKFLRPMARFHLPFADEQETLFRSFATWLLAEHVRNHMAGIDAKASLEGLKHRYEEMSVVNSSLAERLRTVATRDAVLNAVIILDLFAQIAPANIDGDFEDILTALEVED
ncbi:MAG: hypothetical protein HQL42_13555 [Alphaproteobacteria bacterium]|nr:hypothetical protein [Alphaproteobacteria bacterium]